MKCRRSLLALVISIVASSALVASAAKTSDTAESKPKFLRLSRDEDDQPQYMETAIVRYKLDGDADNDLSVDLIGAVHIGEKTYYERLNKEFEQYDVLLYELVAPEGTRVPKGGRRGGGHPVSMLQDGMKDMLELEHQLQHIDYQKENFLHADMSPETFSKSMADRGESMWTLMFRMMGQQLVQQNKRSDRAPETDLFMALFDKNRALSLKRVVAEQFEDLEGAMSAFSGPTGSTIISERNKVALKVLAEQIKAGKKRVGIFYGAGHMPDMEERLVKDLAMHRDGERWIVAWDLRPKAVREAERRAKPDVKEAPAQSK